MTNFEKYKDEILRIATESNSNPAKKDGVVVACEGLACTKCDFDGVGKCRENRFKWLYEDDGEQELTCSSCKHASRDQEEYPCSRCSRGYTDLFEPKKTRQDEFLEIYPNAMMLNGAIDICPKYVDGNCDRCRIYAKRPCIECHKDYWLQEVGE
jgi:hypothetical protein